MSIRVRHVENRDILVQELAPAYRFIELCDLDGNVGAVIFMDDKGTIHMIKPEDPEARRYSSMYKVSFSKLTVIPPDKILEPA